MDVIFKEGMLYHQGVKFGKRTWRKIWMVLFKPSSTGVGRLELYTVPDNNAVIDQKKAGRQKTREKKVVRLSDCISVTPAPKESCPPGYTAFCLSTAQCKYTLASTTSQDWLSALCLLTFQNEPGESGKGGFERGNGFTMEDNDLYSSWKTELPPNQYQVAVQSTEASRRCQLAGDYLVSPEKQAVILLAINTGHIIYRWPYKLLRKFGQVEGGFSIEAGRRCESGEGVFIFLSSHGPQIFQAILKQCTVDRTSSTQSLTHRRSLSDQSTVKLPPKANRPASPPVYNPADTEDRSDSHYSTINDISLLKEPLLVKPYLSNSKEDVEEEGEDEDGRCHSLEGANFDNFADDNIYYNIRRTTPPVVRKDAFIPEVDHSESIYSNVGKVGSPSYPQLQPFSPVLPQPAPQPAPCTPPQSLSFILPKPQYQRHPPANSYIQPGYNAEAPAVDDMKEMEEAISSSTHATPTEAPGSFKHRLAEIISKDLAKFQPPLPSRAGSPTFSQ